MYQLMYDRFTGAVSGINKDGASIPLCEDNADYQEFLEWNKQQKEPLDLQAVYEPSLEEFATKRKTEIIIAVQGLMDTTAQSRGYDNIFTMSSYANSTDDTFKAEGTAGFNWRDKIWITCRSIMIDVETGKRTLPTVDEVLKELPSIELHNNII
jgi:hypothetical protein